MSASMGGLPYSMEMRDIIQRMVVEVLDKERPRYWYGTVLKIDRTKRKCSVVRNGETGAVLVNMGSIQPNAVNQVVRVEGIGIDKYITDVIGDAYNGTRSGVVEPFYTAGKAYVKWDGDDTFSGPYESTNSYYPTASDRVVGVFMPSLGTVLFPLRDYSNDIPYPRWHTVPMQNGWVNYGETYQDFGFTKTATGIVHLRGLIRGGAVTAGTLIATLPEAFRPSWRGMYPVAGSESGTASFRGNVGIRADGVVEVRSMRTAFTSLDNVAYPAASAAPEAAWTQIAAFQNTWGNYRDLVPADTGLWARAGYWKDPDGMVWERGLVRRGDGGNTTGPIFTKPVGYRVPSTQSVHRPSSAVDLGGYVQAFGDGVTQYAGGAGTGYVTLDGIPHQSESVPYTALPLTNGWVNYGAAWATAGYYRTPSKHVHLRGLIQAGAAGPIGYLPPGFRPGKRLLMAATSNGQSARVDITADGALQTGEGMSNVWYSLDSLNFIAEQ